MVCSTRPLPGDDAAGDPCLHAVPQKHQVSRWDHFHRAKLGPAVSHGMTSDGHSGRGIISNHSFLRFHSAQWRDKLLIAVQAIEERSSLPTSSFNLPQRLSPVHSLSNRIQRSYLRKCCQIGP